MLGEIALERAASTSLIVPLRTRALNNSGSAAACVPAGGDEDVTLYEPSA